MSAQRTPRGHLHAEAFCLMWYACKCGHQERIWNSRDGVTPFGMQCPSCGSPSEMGSLMHVRWREDLYAPGHVPAPGQRIWIDMTWEAAEAYAEQRIAAAENRGIVIDPARRESLARSILGEHGGSAPDLRIVGFDRETESAS